MNDVRGVAADSTEAVFTLGPDSRFEHWSEELAALTGVDTDEQATVDPLSVFAPADRTAVREAIGRCLGGHEASVRASLETADGGSRGCQVRLFRTTDQYGSVARVHGVVVFESGAPIARSDGGSRPVAQPSD